MRAVFDLDDTICVHKNRDYPNASPVFPVIEKIRKMKNDGWQIVIYSARGQVSCHGNLDEIERNNRGVVEKWLFENKVPFDELIFGKPLGDVYIDDKGMSLTDFLSQPFGMLSGGSGMKVYRQGNVVRKEFGSVQETEEYKKWTEQNKGEFKYPKVFSYVYNTVYMEYIDGERGCDIEANYIPRLVEEVMRCKATSPQPFDIKPHIERMYRNKTGNNEADRLMEKVAEYLLGEKERLSAEGSFCHGDLTMSNVILHGDDIYTVDARNTTGANSYLLDLAKLRMSLSGYERIFGISEKDNSKWVKYVDNAAQEAGLLKTVVALEIMFIFRCFRYKQGLDREKIIRFALKEGKIW